MYIYICIYISLSLYACCEAITWAKFGLFRGYYLGLEGVILWAKVF